MALYSTYCHRKTKSSLRLDEIPLCGTKSSLRLVEICGRSPQTMKPRNLFGFGASLTLAAIYSRSLHSRRRPRRSCAAAKTGRGTCRPTRRPRARRAASQTAPAVCPRLRGVRARGAGPKQPEKMVGRTTTTLADPATVITEKPAELSFCGLCLPWQLSTLAEPVVQLPSTC